MPGTRRLTVAHEHRRFAGRQDVRGKAPQGVRARDAAVSASPQRIRLVPEAFRGRRHVIACMHNRTDLDDGHNDVWAALGSCKLTVHKLMIHHDRRQAKRRMTYQWGQSQSRDAVRLLKHVA